MSTIYAVADQFVESTIPLPELPRVEAGSNPWILRIGNEKPVRRRLSPFHHWRTARGTRAATFYRDREVLQVHFPRAATFGLNFAARSISCSPVGRREETWRLPLLNQVLPLAFGRDRLVLHASAVATPAGAVAFAGPPGHGKSTLASALAVRGMPLISDDFLVVEQSGQQTLAIPSLVAPRLWPDSVDALMQGSRRQFPRVATRSVKRRITTGVPLATTPMPLAGLFVLGRAEATPALRAMAPAMAVAALTASTFIAQIDERDVVRTTFDRITALVAHVTIRHLTSGLDFSHLPQLCQDVLLTVDAAERS